MTPHEAYLDCERWNFIHDCRTRLELIEHGYIADPRGVRAAELRALIARHALVAKRTR